jgi:hypothetical protein
MKLFKDSVYWDYLLKTLIGGLVLSMFAIFIMGIVFAITGMIGCTPVKYGCPQTPKIGYYKSK